MTEVATRKSEPSILSGVKLPDAINDIINFEGWAQAIVRRKKYTEPNPDFISTMLALSAITAETIDDVFKQADIRKLQEFLPNTPNAEVGPYELSDLYVAASDFESGNPCFVIMTLISMETGEEIKLTTGATNVQATLIGLLKFGQWPLRFKIKRGDSKDKGDRYLIFLVPPD